MANRILRDWTFSENVDQLSFESEVFFTRLIMKADDYGKFHGSEKLLKAALFPLKEVSFIQIKKMISECIKNGIIISYTVDSKAYVQILDFGQRLRVMNSKFPDKLQNDSEALTDDRRPPLERKERNEVETEVETEVEVETKETKFDFKKSLLLYGFDSSLISEWMKIRKVKRNVNSETAFNGFISEVMKSNKDPNEILRTCVERSWSGFKNEWLINTNTNQNGNTKINDGSGLLAWVNGK